MASFTKRVLGRLGLRRAVGFDAGQNQRRLRAVPTNSISINTQIRAYGRTIVARSRYLASNNAYAANAKAAYVSALVGDGIVPSPLVTDAALKKEMQTLWNDWTDQADADGLTDFYGLQSLVAAEMFEAGEVFIRMRPRLAEDGLAVQLQLQLIPSEMLPLERNEDLGGGRRIECGIEFDAIGKRAAYHFLRKHPGDSYQFATLGATDVVRVPAESVLHLFKPIRAGQIRGLPHTLSGIVTAAMIDLYDDAELERKRTAALFGAFVTRPRVAGDEVDDPLGSLDNDGGARELADQFGLEPGAVVPLDIGEDIKFAEPADVGGSYEPFQYRNLARMAAGYGVPYSDMTGDLRQTSYGSIRAGLVQFRRRISADQHQFMVFQFCRAVRARWLDDAVVAGAVSILPAAYLKERAMFQRCKWMPPKFDWIDPQKDITAEQAAVSSGFKSIDDVIEESGYDPEEMDARILAAQQRRETLGIVLPAPATAAAAAPVDPNAPDPNNPTGP